MMEGTISLSGTHTFQVLVHSFSWCSCCEEGYPVNHIKLGTSKRPVEPGQAIALSYGIGDFDRQKRTFGHVNGSTSEPVRLEFGGEWVIHELMSAFVALSEEHGSIWFDQLSIPQDPASITIHLQKMPQVYRTFEVVILLPNAPCPCLRDAFNAWTAEESFTSQDGDFDIIAVYSTCINAFPVSSYYFRLWTKQEFAYARTISIHYCGPPGGQCSSGVLRWMYNTTRIPTTSTGHLSRWASWKYALCVEQMQSQDELLEEMAWSIFRRAHRLGRDHLLDVVAAFHMKKDFELNYDRLQHLFALLARFVLGERLQRNKDDEHENMFSPPSSTCEHVASVQKDFALAVLPAFDGYQLPPNYPEMTLLELVDDGIRKCEQYWGSFHQTTLPLGLFEDGIGSFRNKPSIHLREEHIRCLGDVYGSLSTSVFLRFGIPEMTMLRLREAPEASCPPASRMSQSSTYSEAFGNATTAEVCEFMRKIHKNARGDIGKIGRSRVVALEAWAGAVLSDEIETPKNGWPSPAHEQAVFEESMRYERPWGSLPEIDHGKVCYELMCNYACIHPDVAREKELGLMVKTSDPPCIGLFNGVLYNGIQEIARYQRDHGVSKHTLRTRNNAISPEDWLTIMLTGKYGSRFRTLEALKGDRLTDFPDHVRAREPRMNKSVPIYGVKGVWFYCLKDDPSVGAELLSSLSDDYDAVLI